MTFLRILIFSFLFVGCGESPFDTKNLLGAIRGDDSQESSLEFQTQGLSISYQWTNSPVLYNSNSVEISLTNDRGELEDADAKLKAYLWMPDMNHGSFPVTIKKVSVGKYLISDVYFTMSGRWDFHLQLEDTTSGQIFDGVLWPIDM